MTNADVLLLLIIAGAFLVGFFWGVVRGLLGLAACCIVFVLSAQLSVPVGDYLAGQWTNFGAGYVHTLAFLITFAVLFTVSLLLIQFGTHSGDVSRFPLLDDILGGLLGASIALLTVAFVIIILQTWYGPAAVPRGADAEWSRSLYSALVDSTVGGQVAQSLVPALIALFGPLLPGSIRDTL
jgi:uncharacterized membrane protein required for colicin V production